MDVDRVNKSACRNCADDLADAFPWPESPEGDSFWNHIHDRLIQYAKGHIPLTHCLPDAGGAFNAKLKALCEAQAADLLDLQLQIATMDDKINELKKKLFVSDFMAMGR